MGRVSDFIIEYEDTISDIAKLDLIMTIKYASKVEHKSSEPLRDFLETVLPNDEDKHYWLFAQNGESVINLKYKRTEYIASIIRAANEKVNLFYSPTSYTGWHKDECAGMVKAIYVDIDELNGHDISNWTKEKIIQYIKETYLVFEEMLPNYIIKSGHGVHLYYLLSEEIDDTMRKKYFDFINTHYSADIACRAISHYVRVPTSWNCKKTPKKSELFEVHKHNFTLDELDYFKTTDEAIQKHIDKENTAKAEKSRATRARHKAEKEAAKETENSKSTELSVSTKNKTNRPKKAKPVVEEILYNVEEEELLKIFYDNKFNPQQRYYNILRDLNNYASRRKGRLKGKRDIFAHITATVCRKALMTQDKCFEHCAKYFTQSFHQELMRIVISVYQTKTYNMYRLANIAALLEFTQHDFEESYCCFSAQKRKEKEKERNKQNYAAKSKMKAQETEMRIEYIKTHPDISTAQIMEKYGVKIRTAQRLKERARE